MIKNQNNPIKYLVYARKSSEAEDRQVASIDAQIDELRKIASDSGLYIIDVLSEAKSAKAPGRPIFNSMLQRIYAGEAQGILCWKLDRLARNPVDGGQISWMLQENTIKCIQTYGRAYYPTDNVLMMSVEFGMANQFIRDLSQNVKRGLARKVSLGWIPGVAPAGYLNTPDKEKGMKTVVKDPERFSLIRRMWDLILSGNYTVPQIWKIANSEWNYRTVKRRNLGGQPISRSAVYKILTNPFYYGQFEYPEGSNSWHKGAHEPMIAEEEYDKVQILLGRKGRPRPKKHVFAFTGLMRCGHCGAMITAEEKIKRQKNGNVHRYIYYHCTKRKDENCPEKGIELKDLNSQIDQFLNKITISEKFNNWAIKYLHEIRQTEAQGNEVILVNKQNDLARITKQLDGLLLKYISPENESGQLISEEQYQELKNRLTNEKTVIESELEKQNRTIDGWLDLSEKTFDFARYARIWFAKGDLNTKRAIFACLGSHLIIKDKNLSISPHPMFKTIFESLPQAEKEISQVRTYDKLFNKRKNRAFDPALSTWLRGQDLNLRPTA